MHDGDMILAIILLGRFSSTDHLCRNTKGLAFGDDIGSGLGVAENFHAVAHVVDAKHFCAAGAADLLNCFKDRWDR